MSKLTSENLNQEQLDKITSFIDQNLEEIRNFEERYKNYDADEILVLVTISNYDSLPMTYCTRINLTNGHKIPNILSEYIEEIVGEKFQ